MYSNIVHTTLRINNIIIIICYIPYLKYLILIYVYTYIMIIFIMSNDIQ